VAYRGIDGFHALPVPRQPAVSLAGRRALFAEPRPAQTSLSARLSPLAAFTNTAMMSMIILATILNSVCYL
jgi:hypothetical protein